MKKSVSINLDCKSMPIGHISQPNTVFSHRRRAMIFLPPLTFLNSLFDLATLSLIAAILLFSLFSICFIFHLRFKSRTHNHLQKFNSLWTVRFLLVSLIVFWAINELLRLPLFRRRYLYPFLPSPSLSQQANLCKIHVVLSLGFFEPGFLLTLLFLVNVSIKKRKLHNTWAIVYVITVCAPILLLQIFFVFFSPLDVWLPRIFKTSSFLIMDSFGKKTVLCTYPLMSTIVFCAFGVAYSLGFLLSCWRVVSLVINKGLRFRIYALTFAVLVSLALQILFLGLSVLWRPDNVAYGGVSLAMFVSVLVCAAVGESLLVITPIADALAAGGDCCRWSSGDRSPLEIGGKEVFQEVA